MPAKGFKVCGRNLVAVLVPLDLGLPELHVGLRFSCIAATLVTMPEAAVHHDGNSIFREHYIGTARQFPVLESEPEPTRMKPLPNQNLRFGVFPSDAGHALAALLWG